ncbi:hypothetical protein KM043_009284 [Ampulex compressa]|nr:hypothetical protein KM043_009284 [Ampulex compressa]
MTKGGLLTGRLLLLTFGARRPQVGGRRKKRRTFVPIVRAHARGCDNGLPRRITTLRVMRLFAENSWPAESERPGKSRSRHLLAPTKPTWPLPGRFLEYTWPRLRPMDFLSPLGALLTDLKVQLSV